MTKGIGVDTKARVAVVIGIIAAFAAGWWFGYNNGYEQALEDALAGMQEGICRVLPTATGC